VVTRIVEVTNISVADEIMLSWVVVLLVCKVLLRLYLYRLNRN